EETGTKVGIGVATGCDEVFITTDPHLVEPGRLVPLAMGSDTVGGTFTWSGHYLVDPWNENGVVALGDYPRLSAYFESHRERLSLRHVAQRRPTHWYRTIDRVTHSLICKHKLYLPDIKDRIHPVLDTGQSYPHHNLYFIQSDRWDLEVLGGLLLSDIGQFFVECYGVRMRGGWLRFQAQYLRRIRVPDPDQITADQSARLVAAFRQRDTEAATRVARELYRLDALPAEAG
ncbi:MAG: SAM-dependent methyltransferase, partial [Vicinamibacterales bacterium]